MIIHLLPVHGHQINDAWKMPTAYAKWEELFVRCTKDGKLSKPLNEKTSVYRPFEVIRNINKFEIHW